MEKPLRFAFGKHIILGILHTPGDSQNLSQRVGILFLNAGVRYRIGPYRMYTRIARRLCDAGFYVLRFDAPGIGDSQGEIKNWNDYRIGIVENIEITRCAVDYFKAETGIDRFGLFGLCGGALNAMFTGAAVLNVNFLILLSLPVEELGDYSEKVLWRALLRRYILNLLQWRSWKNLLSLKSNYRSIGKALGQLGNYLKGNAKPDYSLWQAFEKFISRGNKALFVFGTHDIFYEPFVNGFGRRLSQMRQKRPGFEVYTIEKANHLFSQRHWQEMIIRKSIAWVKDNCCMK